MVPPGEFESIFNEITGFHQNSFSITKSNQEEHFGLFLNSLKFTQNKFFSVHSDTGMTQSF